MLEQQTAEATSKLDEANRTLNDFEAAKKKLSMENADYTRQVGYQCACANSRIGRLQILRQNVMFVVQKLVALLL